MKKPYDIIKIDKYTGKVEMPTLLLMNRSFNIIGKIPHYIDWNISLVGNGIDEISFSVNKYVNGFLCPVWNDLIDLKIINVVGFGYFEISVDYTDNTQTVKLVNGVAIETELGQINLYDFHVNDDEVTEYNQHDFDIHGNFIPTVLYNPTDTRHSLLHRVLSDKAPHWNIGYVTPYVTMSEEDQPEDVRKFQRTYTCDCTTIYDFLTGEVAKESNVIFTFDVQKNQETGKLERTINCYSLCDCIDQKTGKLIDENAKGIGEDTLVFISKNKLANEINISSNKDNVKNCFRIEGGDNVITDMVRAVNMNGSNYIYYFADFQYNDMPNALVKAIKKYNEDFSKEADTYYGENGIYIRLCKTYEDLTYYESSMMPEVIISETTAEEQYQTMKNILTNMTIGVSSLANYNNNLFVGVSNNVEAMANILIDSRYKAKIIDDTIFYNSENHTWTGNIQITRVTDETDYYPKTNTDIQNIFTLNISDDELTFTRQKIEKALSKGSMLDIDFDVVQKKNDNEIREYFNLYCLNRLKSFYDGYNSCLSILMQLDVDSDVRKDMYETYYTRMSIVSAVLSERQQQVDNINANISSIINEQKAFQEQWDFKKYLENIEKGLYNIFCSYRREDTYKNSNYISDGLSTTECLKKAKELVAAATTEAKKACVLQRTVSTSLNNLFALPEFEPLYEKFALFNYIRIRTEDEILKLRLVGVEFNGNSIESINVTFSEQIESVDGTINDLQSIIQQAQSISTSFPSTALQAKKGEKAQNTIFDIYTNGLNAAKTMLTNNDNNETTITESGIICRRMDDVGSYGDKQFRITGNIIAFTTDKWESVELAIGEIKLYNPITKKYEYKYGVLAPAIVGELIAGNNMIISDKNGTVLIDGTGIELDGGAIRWKTPIKQNGVSGLTNALDAINFNIEQLDGRIQTYSQENDPKMDEKTKWNDSENEMHIGDIWVKPSTGITYIYTLNNGFYEWKESNDSTLASLASRKSTIFTSKPSVADKDGYLYKQNDVWILNKNTILHGKQYTKGTMLTALESSKTFVESHWEEKVRYTDDTQWKEWTSENGEFGKYKEQIAEQFDGKANCTYGGSAPPTNPAPETGDLWYCTDSSNGYGKDKAYMYDGSDWKESNGVPDSVWDIVYGKSSIFVTKPNKPLSVEGHEDYHFYYKGDLWILEQNYTLNGTTYDKGCILTAKQDSPSVKNGNNFNETDWDELNRYGGLLDDLADDSKLTPSEKQQLDITWKAIKNEYEERLKTCTIDLYKDKLSDTEEYMNYNNAYQTLNSYLHGENGLLKSLTETSDINSTIFKDNFSAYYSTKETLDKFITEIISETKASVISNEDIEKFKKKVAGWITGDTTTVIDSDSVFAPYIGGGYGYWTNGKFSVEIDPNYTTGDNRTKDGYLFCIRDKSKTTDEDVIMGVDTNGDGYFSGELAAAIGTFCGTVEINGTNGIGAITIKGSDVSDRVQVQAENNGQTYYSRQDYQKFYVGDNESVTNSNKGIIMSLFDNAYGIPHIESWCNSEYDNGGYLGDRKCSFSLTSYKVSGYEKTNDIKWGWEIGKNGIYLSKNQDNYFKVDILGNIHTDGNIYSLDGKLSTSDKNKKHDIKNLPHIYEELFNRLNAVSYIYNGRIRTHIGFIAQDIETILNDIGLNTSDFAGYWREQKRHEDKTGNIIYEFDKEGNPIYECGLRYEEFIPLNSHMTQKAHKRIDELEKQVMQQQNKIEKQQKEIDELKTFVSFLMEK